jgi:2-polyprenyl-3-methyl-5-hydroxy-6-metoxy-1,4-benzoquinol methylase
MTADELSERYFVPLGAAFARGRLPELGGLGDAEAFREGLARGLRLHKFKRNAALPRVRRVLSMLAGLSPSSLLDVGSGRGTFLWPLLDALPELPVTAIDRDERRASDLAAAASGGLARLSAHRMDATTLAFADGAFDGATALEVLEHMPEPERAARELVRVARRFVVVTVPSRPDDNPEHLHLLDGRRLSAMFTAAGARTVRVDHVHGHVVALALK